MEMIKSSHSGKAYVLVLTELPQGLHRALRIDAAARQITFKSMLRVALQAYAEQHGLLPAAAAEEAARR